MVIFGSRPEVLCKKGVIKKETPTQAFSNQSCKIFNLIQDGPFRGCSRMGGGGGGEDFPDLKSVTHILHFAHLYIT